jgi:uroporphyrinogen decarboxylase
MTKRDVMIEAMSFRRPAYVPWSWHMTQRMADRMKPYLRTDTVEGFDESHMLDFHVPPAPWVPIDEGHIRDPYGVAWDRTIDKDIGTPCEWPIRSPKDLARYRWPNDPRDDDFATIRATVAERQDLFTRYSVHFSLFERAWTMRGMENLLVDMIERPRFVEEFLDAIVDHNLDSIHRALACGVDAVYFGDDYGTQRGLFMGIERWRRFFKPRLARMFQPVRQAGKFACLHSCGQVDSIFDDLVEIGLNMFNPFQPEVMDVFAMKKKYHGRLAFHGGMSIQRVLPFGTVADVKREAQRLIDAGREGGYVFSPSHDVPADVPPENLVAMMEVLRAHPGYS